VNEDSSTSTCADLVHTPDIGLSSYYTLVGDFGVADVFRVEASSTNGFIDILDVIDRRTSSVFPIGLPCGVTTAGTYDLTDLCIIDATTGVC